MSLKLKRKDTSDVWKHFTKKTGDFNIATCKYCASDISRGGKNAVHKGFTTSNMWAHVKRFHLDEVKKCDEGNFGDAGLSETPTQSTIPKLFSNCSVYDINHPCAKEITQLIAEEICLDMEPLDHVNKEGFQRLMKKICPKYVMVSRTHIAQTILPDIYTRVKAKVQSELKNIPYISVTTDLWTSDASSHINDFISITAHGISNEFEVKNFYLEVLPFEGENHCSENIAHNLNLAFLEWGITEKVQAITTDNARNIVNSVKVLGFEHIPCMVHTVQLVLHDALLEQKKVKDMLKTARKIVGHFSHSTVAMKILQVAQETYNLPQHVLIQDVPTRWDATYHMLRRLYEQRVAIQAVLPKLNCLDDLNTQQWIMMEQAINILSYFEDVTNALSKDRAMLSDVIPLVSSLFKILDRIKSDMMSHEDVKIMAEDLSKQLSFRYGNIENNNSYIMATALDPRYKTRVFRMHSTAEKAKELLYFTLGVEESSEQQASTSSSKSSTHGGIWSICQEIIDDTEGNEPLLNFVVNTAKEEADAFLKSANITHTADPILYWKENLNYPRLQKLALKYLSYKPSSVSSERLFSTAGLIQSNKRNRLTPSNLKTLCFLNKNLSIINFEY